MCDLTPSEQALVATSIADIVTLTAQVNDLGTTIAETAFMDHERLSLLLTTLSEHSARAAQWVALKPHEHAGHDH
jgi:hypothetical protein